MAVGKILILNQAIRIKIMENSHFFISLLKIMSMKAI